MSQFPSGRGVGHGKGITYLKYDDEMANFKGVQKKTVPDDTRGFMAHLPANVEGKQDPAHAAAFKEWLYGGRAGENGKQVVFYPNLI